MMSYGDLLLTQAESRKVVVEINTWCRRTGTNYNKLVVAAGFAPSLRSDVETRGRCLTARTAQKIRRAMLMHAAGISKEQHKKHLGANRTAVRIEINRQVREYVETLRVDRTPCPRCGVRADVGCAHQRNFEPYRLRA